MAELKKSTSYLKEILISIASLIVFSPLAIFNVFPWIMCVGMALLVASVMFALNERLSKTFRKYLFNFAGMLLAYVLVGILVEFELLSRYWISIIIFISINIIMATSLNLSTGFLGQLILGHAGFMAIGAYTAALIGMPLFNAGMPVFFVLVIGLIAGGLLASIFSIIIGVPALRLRGDYLGIMTLAFGEIVRVSLNNLKFTGGAHGLPGIPRITTYHNSFIIMLLCVSFIVLLVRSRHGRAIISLRENEIAAEAVGISSTRYKVTGLAISAFIGGIGGGLYAFQLGYLQPLMFGFMKSVDILIMVVLGGMGSMTGSVLAAGVFTWLPEALREVNEYRMVLYGVLLIVMMIVRPQGIFGTHEMTFASRVLAKIKARKEGGKK
jgi:branched-chain amino acid transport system permease protein